MLNAEQMDSAGRAWHFLHNYEHDDGRGALYCGGPYRVLACGPASNLEPYAVACVREIFDGTDIAYLHPTTGTVVRGQLTLYAVPQGVYTVAGWQAHDSSPFSSALEDELFAQPPTEADMEATFVRGLSQVAEDTETRNLLAGGFTEACRRLGWRTVANTINAMDEHTLARWQNVLAVLAALASEPAR